MAKSLEGHVETCSLQISVYLFPLSYHPVMVVAPPEKSDTNKLSLTLIQTRQCSIITPTRHPHRLPDAIDHNPFRQNMTSTNTEKYEWLYDVYVDLKHLNTDNSFDSELLDLFVYFISHATINPSIQGGLHKP